MGDEFQFTLCTFFNFPFIEYLFSYCSMQNSEIIQRQNLGGFFRFFRWFITIGLWFVSYHFWRRRSSDWPTRLWTLVKFRFPSWLKFSSLSFSWITHRLYIVFPLQNINRITRMTEAKISVADKQYTNFLKVFKKNPNFWKPRVC